MRSTLTPQPLSPSPAPSEPAPPSHRPAATGTSLLSQLLSSSFCVPRVARGPPPSPQGTETPGKSRIFQARPSPSAEGDGKGSSGAAPAETSSRGKTGTGGNYAIGIVPNLHPTAPGLPRRRERGAEGALPLSAARAGR